jgi:hypothetical protein
MGLLSRRRGRRPRGIALVGCSHRGFALVRGRPGLPGRARPHLADPRHREAFGVAEQNISAFRRRVCGDFTSALRFSGPAAGYPRSPAALTLAAAETGLLTAQQEVFARPVPQVPVSNEPVPRH